jgi:ATP-dependent DNA helicase RecG
LPTAKISTYLDEGKLNHFLELSNIENKLPNEDLLINLDVAIKDSETYFNNAGILFFSDASKAFLPHSSIDCVLFKGTDKANISDRKEFDDDIISNIEDALLFCRTHLKVEYKIDGSRRTEVLEIPEVALREAIVNAVAHRDYLVTGARVSIEIFDDRVDISNPGGLPPGLSKNEFGKRSLTRNPILSSLLYRSKYIERLGTGISRIKDALKNVNLPEPIFHFDGFFTITIRRIDIYIRTIGDKYEVPISRAIRIKSILESLNSDTEFIVKDVAEALNVNDRTIRKDLEFLLDNGLISSSGSTKSTVYHIDERGKTLIK